MTHLSNKALLVHLTAGQWMGRKLDRRATKQVADLNNASTSAGRYTKYLLPTCDELKAVHAKTAEIRKAFYRNTLPWGIEGTYILPSANYLPFMTAFRNEREEWEQLVNNFLTVYGDAVEQAEHSLRNMFDSNQYPPAYLLRDRFRLDMEIMPVPTAGDFRVEIVDDELAAITADIEERVSKAQSAAMDEAWSRLYAHVEKFVERLADPKNIFHDTLIENAKETCDLLKRLNVTDDPNLEALRQQVEEKLTGYHPDTLRFDPDVRRQAAEDAAAIQSAMGAFMRGVQ